VGLQAQSVIEKDQGAIRSKERWLEPFPY